jgi:hypothetical protein
LLNPNFGLNYEVHKKEKSYMYIESEIPKYRKSVKIAGHSENEIIPPKWEHRRKWRNHLKLKEMKIPTWGFLETQYMSPSKSPPAISSAKDRGPLQGKNIAYLAFPMKDSKAFT